MSKWENREGSDPSGPLEGSAPPGPRSPASEPEGGGSCFPLKEGRVSREHTGKDGRRAAGIGEFGERVRAAGYVWPGCGSSRGWLG